MWRKECNMAKRLYSRVKLMKLWVSVTIYTCMHISACCQYLSNVRIFAFFSLIQLQETLFLSCNLKTIQNLRGSMMTYMLSIQSLSLRRCVASSLFLLILMAGSFWSNLTLGRLLNQVRYIDSLFFACHIPLSLITLSNKISVLHVLILYFVWIGQHKAINDEGMPQHGRPFMKGRLFVEFNVEFPEAGALSPAQCRSLEKILPPKPGSQLSDMELDQCEETTLHDVNIEEEMRRRQQQKRQEAYDEDEEEAGPRVQCAQQ